MKKRGAVLIIGVALMLLWAVRINAPVAPPGAGDNSPPVVDNGADRGLIVNPFVPGGSDFPGTGSTPNISRRLS